MNDFAPLSAFPGTATSSFPARRMSTGRPGRRGNAARWLAEEASNHVAEPARTATTVPDAVRYVQRWQFINLTQLNPLAVAEPVRIVTSATQADGIHISHM